MDTDAQTDTHVSTLYNTMDTDSQTDTHVSIKDYRNEAWYKKSLIQTIYRDDMWSREGAEDSRVSLTAV
jgi:hypothetical protein